MPLNSAVITIVLLAHWSVTKPVATWCEQNISKCYTLPCNQEDGHPFNITVKDQPLCSKVTALWHFCNDVQPVQGTCVSPTACLNCAFSCPNSQGTLSFDHLDQLHLDIFLIKGLQYFSDQKGKEAHDAPQKHPEGVKGVKLKDLIFAN